MIDSTLRPCCVFLMRLGELAPPRTTILGFRDFRHFFTDFMFFFKNFKSFISRDAVLRSRVKFNKFNFLFESVQSVYVLS